MRMDKIAMITGASSGIGKSTCLALAEIGYHLAIGSRNIENLQSVQTTAKAHGVTVLAVPLDVRHLDSAENFVQQAMATYGRIDVLVNNAGLARGVTRIADQHNEEEWQEMIDTNLMGLARMTRLVVPIMIKQQAGHVVNIGSTAGHEAYPGGSMYAATKFGERAFTTALRQELLGTPIRVTSIDPGMVETQFSMVRFNGDKAKADAVYAGVTPLVPDDIADLIVFAVTRKSHVNLETIVVRPVDQASNTMLARKTQVSK